MDFLLTFKWLIIDEYQLFDFFFFFRNMDEILFIIE